MPSSPSPSLLPKQGRMVTYGYGQVCSVTTRHGAVGNRATSHTSHHLYRLLKSSVHPKTQFAAICSKLSW
jgi:hypothetical protein